MLCVITVDLALGQEACLLVEGRRGSADCELQFAWQ